MYFYIRNRETGSYDAGYPDWERASAQVENLNSQYQTNAWYITQVAPNLGN